MRGGLKWVGGSEKGTRPAFFGAGCGPARAARPVLPPLQISNGTIPKTHTRRWRVSRLIYLMVTWPDITFSVRTLSQYIQEDPCRNSSSKVHQRITRTRIVIAIRKQSDIDSLLQLRLGRLSDNSEISIWVLHFSWFFYYLMEVKKTNKRIKIISGSRIPRDDQYLFGDSLVAISLAGFKGVM